MDADKDGIIGKNDLRAAFDSVGRLATDKEIEEMLNEAPAPINFTQLLNLLNADTWSSLTARASLAHPIGE